MDLRYLLWLQDWRNATGNVLTPLMEFISDFAIGFWPVALMCFVYWAVCHRAGSFLLFSYACAILLNGVLKLTACVYRPWIRDAVIIPAGDAIRTATGYSFPSGHSTIATAIYGGSALCLWRAFKWRLIPLGLFGAVLLTMFSRNYLGVHTPQDVLAGFCVTLILLFINFKMLEWANAKVQNRDIKFVLTGLVILVVIVFYINLKPYPMDYVDGRLLVDPVRMMPDTYQAVGSMIGFLIGFLADKRFIKYEVQRTPKEYIIAAIALVPLYFWYIGFAGAIQDAIGRSWALFVRDLVMYIYILIMVPVIIKTLRSKSA